MGDLMDKDLKLEIKKDLKALKSNRPYLTYNQLISTACHLQHIKRNNHITFENVESIYKESNQWA